MSEPIPMLLWCPSCGARHVDAGEFATKPHHTHACQSCGMVWRPAIVPTCGVLFLPGFKDGQLGIIKNEKQAMELIDDPNLNKFRSRQVASCGAWIGHTSRDAADSMGFGERPEIL